MADDDSSRSGNALKYLGAIGVLVTVVAGLSALAFNLRPSLKPCFGASSVKFTGEPVFPRVRFRDHLVREGAPPAVADKDPGAGLLGAEVRYSYQTSGFRGSDLPLTWTLVTVNRDGTTGSVVPGQDRNIAMIITPDSCSDSGGQDLWVQTDSGSRYRVVLELYRNLKRNDRLALVETDVFHG